MSESEQQREKYFNFWPFKNNSKQTELYDSKLDLINNKRKNQIKDKK